MALSTKPEEVLACFIVLYASMPHMRVQAAISLHDKRALSPVSERELQRHVHPYESVQRYIVKPGEVHAVRPTRCRQGSKLCGCDHKNSPSVRGFIYGRCGRYVDSG